jgi:hypothetical protein
MDCGSRASTEEPCARCREPRLDLRKSAVKLACLDDDDRRKAKREQRLLWASIPLALVSVALAQQVLGEYAVLIPGLSGFLGYIIWGIVLSLGAWKGLGKLFPAERRFPYLAAHQLAEPSLPSHETSDYRTLAPPVEAAPESPRPFVPAPSHGAALKWPYLVLTVTSFALAGSFCVIAVDQIGRLFKHGDPLDHALLEWMVAGGLAAYLLASALGLAWIHASWKAVPEQFRVAKDGRYITPYQAAVNMLIPLYNLYWLFYMHGTLCDAIDAQLVRLGSRRRAPRTLAMIASGIYLVPYLNLAIAPVLWVAYMFAADGAKEEMLSLLRDEQNRQPAAAARAPW